MDRGAWGATAHGVTKNPTRLGAADSADQSLSGYFNIIPPGGDVSLVPKQIFTQEKPSYNSLLAFSSLNILKTEWFSKAVVERRTFSSEHLGSLCWKQTSLLFRDVSSASSGNSGRNSVFWGCIWWELGDPGTGWLLGRLFFFFLKVTQSCLTLCNSIGYTVHGILQARILEWVAFPFSRGSSQPRDQMQASRLSGKWRYTLAVGWACVSPSPREEHQIFLCHEGLEVAKCTQ